MSQESIKAEAELYADQKGKLNGFKRGTPKWEKAVKEFIDDAYYSSIVPGEQNPHSPKVTWPLLNQEFPKFSEYISKQLGITNVKDSTAAKQYLERVESAVTNIVQVYVELELRLKNKDFNYPKGAKEPELKDVELNRYKRLMIASCTIMVLGLIFRIKKSDIEGLIEDAAFADKLTSAQLRSQPARKAFVKKVIEEMRPVLMNVDLPRGLAGDHD